MWYVRPVDDQVRSMIKNQSLLAAIVGLLVATPAMADQLSPEELKFFESKICCVLDSERESRCFCQ